MVELGVEVRYNETVNVRSGLGVAARDKAVIATESGG
jgi:hypothetical protein